MSSDSGTGRPMVTTEATSEVTTGQIKKKRDCKHPEAAYRVHPKVVQTAKSGRADKLQRLINYLLAVNDQKFTGYIKVNYTQGSIGRIEKFEEILSK